MLCPLSADIEIYRSIIEHLPEAVIVLDRAGQPVLWNSQAQTLLGDNLEALGLSSHAPGRCDRHRHLSIDAQPLPRLLAGETLTDELLVLGRGGEPPHRLLVNGRPLPGELMLVSLRSLPPWCPEPSPESSALAPDLYDKRTGLPTPPLFRDRVSHALARMQPGTKDLMALFCIGLEGLPPDEIVPQGTVQRQIINRLQSVLGPQHTLTVLTPYKIALLVEAIPTGSSAIAMAEQLRDSLDAPWPWLTSPRPLVASVGIALGPGQYQTPDHWLQDAELALDQSWQTPDQGWHILNSGLHRQGDQRLQTELDLRRAIIQGELRLYYQPIVTIKSQEIIGFEALVRWQHPTRGLLSPAAFIGIAEETGLIIPLGWWVLEEACRQMQRWGRTYPTMAALTISVNMSSKQFTQPDLVQQLQSLLQETGFSAQRLKIEVTEGVLIDNSDTIIATLNQLKAMGIQLLVDDFGTGYSSLSYLHRFPFDCLKIDRSFIENADQDFEKLEILQSVVRLAWNLGLDVVAEGIETPKHYAQLKALRCELGQGYLFSKPVAPEAIEAMMVEPLRPEPL